MATFDKAVTHMKAGLMATLEGNDYVIKGQTLYYAHVHSRVAFTLKLYEAKNWRLR